MSKRRATGAKKPAPQTFDEPIDVRSRIAWTYLGCFGALAIGALLALAVGQFLPGALCGVYGTDSEAALNCEFAVNILDFLVCFAIGFLVLIRPLKLDVWLILGLIAFTGAVLCWGDFLSWYWWLALLLSPALAAAASFDWFKPPWRYVQRIILALLACASLTWLILGITLAA
ncbi:MAG: hypothetical protein LBR20_01110 [Propionibacteriaceae bacterium]|jgi:hypothetical protein|nr:hypothetical protein [Propionibacteriaceae bacterium]